MPYSTRAAARLVAWLLAAELVLAGIHLLIHAVAPGMRWGPARLLFDIDRDLSIPSWFSSVQLFLLGLVLLLAAHNNGTRSRLPSHFLVLAASASFFLSADEGAGIHEQVTRVVRDAGLTAVLFKGGHGGWVMVYGVIALMAAVLVRRHAVVLWRDYRRESSIAAAGVATYLAGGLGIEVLGWQFGSGGESRWDAVRNAVEEFCEMSGVTLLLLAALLLVRSLSRPTTDTTGTATDQ